ncbi:MAG: N-acetylmuramoyl-L-alanine amidase, partial [Oscillospiraceae bacterium]|nr:N-acetylmuramoyl-L-alanine amidase [Oscillospiraceae bacterium]
IAAYLRDELVARGASVLLLDTANGMTIEERVTRAENFNAHMFVSIHNNAAQNLNATGTEVYFFTPFSRNMAVSASAYTAAQLSTNNRGARHSYYHITLSQQFMSILVECGFMTNRGEYEKLIQSANQRRIAAGLAESLSNTLQNTFTGITGSGGGHNVIAPPDNDNNSGGAGAQQSAGFIEDIITLRPGGSITLTIRSGGNTMNNSDFIWGSENPGIAQVDDRGTVTAAANEEGSTWIFAESKDGSFSVSCEIIVSDSG